MKSSASSEFEPTSLKMDKINIQTRTFHASVCGAAENSSRASVRFVKIKEGGIIGREHIFESDIKKGGPGVSPPGKFLGLRIEIYAFYRFLSFFYYIHNK